PLGSFPQTCEIPPVVGKLPCCFSSTPDNRTINKSVPGHTAGAGRLLASSPSVLFAAAPPSRRPALHLLCRQVAKVAAVPSLRLSPPVRSGVVFAGAYMPWRFPPPDRVYRSGERCQENMDTGHVGS